MANGLYTSYKVGLLTALINVSSDDIRPLGVDGADYTVNLGTHDALDDIPSGARVAVPSAGFASKTTTSGQFGAAAYTFSEVSGDQFELLVIYEHSGSESTSDLMVYYDTFSSGMPVTPNGGDIQFSWSSYIYAVAQ